MQREIIQEDVRVQVIGADRWHLPVGTEGTIWQAFTNPKDERVARILWDTGEEMLYMLERVGDDRIVPAYTQVPGWAADLIKQWRSDEPPADTPGWIGKALSAVARGLGRKEKTRNFKPRRLR